MNLENAVVTVTVDGKVQEKFMVNLPNIRSLKGFLQGAWDLSVYNDCFPKKNRLGDVDGSVEIFGHTLHVEFKESRYSLNQGQVLKAIRQAENSNISTIFIFGKTNKPVGYTFITPQNLQADYVEADQDSIKQVMKDWAKYAEENNLVKNRSAEWDLVRHYFRSEKTISE